jgi:hypothetical protein
LKEYDMSRSLSTAKRTTLATEVVTTITKTMAMIDNYFDNNQTPGFRNKPSCTMPGDGSLKFHLPTAINPFAPISKHQEISDTAFVSKLEKCFAPAAEALAILVPGQFLHWSISDSKNARHALSFGAVHDQQISVIDTVLQRWKAPLVRLSQYFDKVDEEDQASTDEVQSWHLDLRPDHSNSENQYESTPLAIQAKSLDEAFRLAAFHTTFGAVPTPSDCHNRYAYKLGKPFSRADFIAISKAAYWPIEAEIEKGQERLQDGLEDHIHKVQGLIDILRQNAGVSIHVDLLAGTAKVTVNRSHFALGSDFEADADQIVRLEEAANAFAAHMSEALKIIHPNAYQAKASFQAPCHRDEHATSYLANAEIDHLCMHASLQSVEAFFDKAKWLRATTADAPLRLYALSDRSSTAPNLVGVKKNMRYTVATSPAHAAVIFGYHFSESGVIQEAQPMPYDAVRSARMRREAAMTVYEK